MFCKFAIYTSVPTDVTKPKTKQKIFIDPKRKIMYRKNVFRIFFSISLIKIDFHLFQQYLYDHYCFSVDRYMIFFKCQFCTLT